jgi:microsomal dipeptidase-like Zn-dependent dipeptidase
MSFNIDIHCHPTTKPFMTALTDADKKNPFISFNHDIEGLIVKIIQGMLAKQAEVTLKTQSNFDHLFEGNHRVVIASITPMERAFLVANRNRNTDQLFEVFIKNIGTFDGTIKPQLINALMGFSVKNIEFVRNSNGLQNYFTEGLVPEYNYLKGFHNKKSKLHKYTLKLVNSFSEIDTSDSSIINVVLSVEGAHSFRSIVPKTNEIASTQGATANLNVMEEDAQDIDNNILLMKKWKYVPFFVTLLHHFWNGMGGHARSLNKMVGEMLNQQEGMNQGLSITGKMVIKALLRDDNGPRILIDIKHMSIASRKEYYAMLKTEPLFKNKKVPIICSHTGVAGAIDTLDQLSAVKDKTEESNNNNYFHKAQINLCGEDISTIADSDGLIGIQLDEKRIAGAGFVKTKFRGGLNNNELMNACAEVIMSNVFIIVKAAGKKGWDICSIGSDFDGLINHLDPFPTAASITVLRDEIEFYLGNLHDVLEPQTGNVIFSVAEMKALMGSLTPSAIVEKLFSANAMAFLKKNFNR